MAAVFDLSPIRHILVVDDDRELRGEIGRYLADYGFVIHMAADGLAADRVLAAAPIDLVILDVMLPGEDGLSICRRLRARGAAAIIMVSAMGGEIDRVLGLELGADDYLAKPCSPRELLARVKAVLRRQSDGRRPAIDGAGYRFLGFTLDAARRQLRTPSGATVLLTAGEIAMLNVFLENPRQVMSRDRLVELALGAEADVFDRAVDVQISRLRRKLHAGGDEDIIKTVRGAGYLFDAAVSHR